MKVVSRSESLGVGSERVRSVLLHIEREIFNLYMYLRIVILRHQSSTILNWR